jgi:5-deoxy-glucuronate isomerase
MSHRNEYFYERGRLSNGGWETVVDSSIPGWRHTGLRVAEVVAGAELALPAGEIERLIIPLSGSFEVNSDGEQTGLAGRRSVFDGPTDVLYLGVGRAATVTGAGRVAVAEAPATRARPSRHVRRDEIAIELRGAGRCSRQVHNFGTAEQLDAERFIVCEVLTPAENWSSYPPHKHDVSIPGSEAPLEEIYYFETALARGVGAHEEAEPFGFFRTYASSAREIDTFAEVHTGDVALVPYGWHGPAVAAPGYDLYYLNVMAGPDPERVWRITDDPAHAWVRDTWLGQTPDPRLPFTTPPTAIGGDA